MKWYAELPIPERWEVSVGVRVGEEDGVTIPNGRGIHYVFLSVQAPVPVTAPRPTGREPLNCCRAPAKSEAPSELGAARAHLTATSPRRAASLAAV